MGEDDDVDEDDIRRLAGELPGAEVTVAGPDDGSPEVAWGDTFCYAASAQEAPRDRTQPFATIVTKDYPGFDEASRLDRAGVFRLNVGLGRTGFAELFGYPPSEQAEHAHQEDPATRKTRPPWTPGCRTRSTRRRAGPASSTRRPAGWWRWRGCCPRRTSAPGPPRADATTGTGGTPRSGE